jgi:GTP-binding protein EngB required for normal cell division
MKTKQTHKHYMEWLSAEQMHEASKAWLSELEFISDEHHFFEDLVTTFTTPIIQSGKFSDTKEIIDAINRSNKQNNELIEAVKTHKNELHIMVDKIDQIEQEKAYANEHKTLMTIIADFLTAYRSLKLQLFEMIKNIKKEDKFKHLIDKR